MSKYCANDFIAGKPDIRQGQKRRNQIYGCSVVATAAGGCARTSTHRNIVYELDFTPSMGNRGNRESMPILQWLSRAEGATLSRHTVCTQFVPDDLIRDQLISLQRRQAQYVCDWPVFDFSALVTRLVVGLYVYANTGSISSADLTGGRPVSASGLSATSRTSAVGIGNVFLPNALESMTRPNTLAALISAATGCGAHVILEAASVRPADNTLVIPDADDEALAAGMIGALQVLHSNYAAHGCVDLFFAAYASGLSKSATIAHGNFGVWRSYLADIETTPLCGGLSAVTPLCATLTLPTVGRTNVARHLDSMLLLLGAAITTADEGRICDGHLYPTLVPGLMTGPAVHAAHCRPAVISGIEKCIAQFTALCGHKMAGQSAGIAGYTSFCITTAATRQVPVHSAAVHWCVEPTGIILDAAPCAGIVKPVATVRDASTLPLWGSDAKLEASAAGVYSVSYTPGFMRDAGHAWFYTKDEMADVCVNRLTTNTQLGWGTSAALHPQFEHGDDVFVGVDVAKCYSAHKAVIAVRESVMVGWSVTPTRQCVTTHYNTMVTVRPSLLRAFSAGPDLQWPELRHGPRMHSFASWGPGGLAQPELMFGDFADIPFPETVVSGSEERVGGVEHSEAAIAPVRDTLGRFVDSAEDLDPSTQGIMPHRTVAFQTEQGVDTVQYAGHDYVAMPPLVESSTLARADGSAPATVAARHAATVAPVHRSTPMPGAVLSQVEHSPEA